MSFGNSVNKNEHENGFRERNLDQFKSSRTMLHDKRMTLNKQINMNLLYKRGASNLISATNDKSTKTKATQEISDLDMNLSKLKAELDFLNCSFSQYQSVRSQLPMIPIGMKDTVSVDLETLMFRFIKEHYYDESAKYLGVAREVNDLRLSIVSPKRSQGGIEKHKRYYTLLSRVDQRFFSRNVKRNFWFDWNDSFTGISFKQASLAFEKGCVLFNIGALYSQLATFCDRHSPEGLLESKTHFIQSARIFRMLRENFSFAPSPDMSQGMLALLVKLMMLQGQECDFLNFAMNANKEIEDFRRLGYYIGQAMDLSQKFEVTMHTSFGQEFEILPSSWTGMFEIKSKYYKAQAYYRLAAALLGLAMYGSDLEALSDNSEQMRELDLQVENELSLWMKEIHNVVRFTKPLNTEEANSIRGNKRSAFASLSKKSGDKTKQAAKRSHSTLGTWRKRSKSPRTEGSVDEYQSEISGSGSVNEEEAIKIPKNRFDACQVGIACLKEAIRYMEEIARVIRLNKDLCKQEDLQHYVDQTIASWSEQREKLKPSQLSLQRRFAPDYPIEDTISSLNGADSVSSRTGRKLRKTTSSASQYSKKSVGSANPNNQHMIHVAPRLLPFVSDELSELPPRVNFLEEFPSFDDPFHDLGPVEFFNARFSWTAPRTVRMFRDSVAGYGFCIKGNAPIEIVSVDGNSPAEEAGVKKGDILIGLNGANALWMSHEDAVAKVRNGCPKYPHDQLSEKESNVVQLTVVTPLPETITTMPSTPVARARSNK